MSGTPCDACDKDARFMVARICETCVYCSFAGNCDRYDRSLASIEQPACDAYEIHPLLAENAKLREDMKDLEAHDQILRDRLNQDHDLRRLAENENAKLRKLVRGLDYCSDELNSAECDRCPLHDATDENLEPKCVRMMRELGIEEDE